MIEQHHVCLCRGYCSADLLKLAITHKKARARLLARPGDCIHRLYTSRNDQLAKFARVFISIVRGKINIDQNRTLTNVRTLKQWAVSPSYAIKKPNSYKQTPAPLWNPRVP